MLLSGQLTEAIEGADDPSDEEILSAAADVANADPKKRFGATAVRQLIAKRRGVEYLTLKTTMERRLADLVKANKGIVVDRVRGFYRFSKTSGDAEGLAFKSTSRGGFEVLLGGQSIGEITMDAGEFISGSSRQRSKVYVVDVEVEGHDFTGHNAPPYFDKLGDAKKWLRDRLSK